MPVIVYIIKVKSQAWAADWGGRRGSGWQTGVADWGGRRGWQTGLADSGLDGRLGWQTESGLDFESGSGERGHCPSLEEKLDKNNRVPLLDSWSLFCFCSILKAGVGVGVIEQNKNTQNFFYCKNKDL